MKRILAFALAMALCLPLWACGEEVAAETTVPPVTNGAEKLKDPATLESMAGTYQPRLWFLEHTLTLNPNGAYTFGSETGSWDTDGITVSLDSPTVPTLLAGNQCIYTFNTWCFDADTDTGITFTPDHNGMTDQSFEARTPGGKIPGCECDWICLDLNADGTFALQLGNKTDGTPQVQETFTGTYTAPKNTLLLTYNGQDYPLIVSNANYIYFFIYDKV